MVFQHTSGTVGPTERALTNAHECPTGQIGRQRFAAQIGCELMAAEGKVERLREGLQPKRQRMRGNKAALAHFTQLQTRTQNVQPFERGQLRRRPEPRVSKGDGEAIGQFYLISFQKFADGYGQLFSGLDGLNFTCAVAAAFQ